MFQFNWLRDFGPEFGWRRVFNDLTLLQTAANEGKVGIICAQRRNLNRSGHICPVVPETAEHKALRAGDVVVTPLQSQAGTRNHQYHTQRWWTNDGPNGFREFGFWLHD